MRILKCFVLGVLTTASVSEAQILSSTDKRLLRECASRLQSAALSDPLGSQNVHRLSNITREYQNTFLSILENFNRRVLHCVDVQNGPSVWDTRTNLNTMIASLSGINAQYIPRFQLALSTYGERIDGETGWMPNRIFTFAYQLTAIVERVRDYLYRNYDLRALGFLDFNVLSLIINENYETQGGCIPGIINRLFQYALQGLIEIAELEESGIELDSLLAVAFENI